MNRLHKCYLAIIVIIGITFIAECKKEKVPVITTTSVSNITAITASGGGNITDEGSSAVISRGVCWSTSTPPTIADSKTTDGTGAGSFSSNLTALNAVTNYYLRAYATNSVGTAYGVAISFTTLGQPPAPTNSPATNITPTGATLNGSVNANYLSAVVTFEYGITTNYGSSVTATQSPVTGSTNTNISIFIIGLAEGTTYHYRIKAVNSLGTTYGSDLAFTTVPSSTVTDIDGNTYNTVTIGTQVWMKENLKTTKYRNGDLIGTTTPATLDTRYDDPSQCYQWAYAGDESKVATYGRLYTWYAVAETRNICPKGWHVPSDGEWQILFTYLGGYDPEGAGSKLKEAGLTHWLSPNEGATNESGFTALPCGTRDVYGTFSGIGRYCYWWSSTQSSSDGTVAIGHWLDNINASIDNAAYTKQNGWSVRCLKD